MRFVAYLRVSTDKQGRSGLGLDAQRTAVANHVSSRGELVAEFVEVESGKLNERPQLVAALAEARRQNAILLIAKLDRLARNVAFIANLLEAGVEVAAADMPEANRFVLHIMAAVAEQEGRAISDRTKAALAAAKERGTKLGWAMPERRQEQQKACRAGALTNRIKADTYAKSVRPLIEQYRTDGISYSGIATRLNENGIATARGGKWYATTVSNVMNRA